MRQLLFSYPPRQPHGQWVRASGALMHLVSDNTNSI